MSKTSHVLKRIGRFVVACAFVSAAASCAPGRPNLAPEILHSAAPSAEVRLEEATVLYGSGQYQEAADLLREALRGATAYRVMPELLYLFGLANEALGESDTGALSFELLQRYYPRRWSALPDRERLERVVEELQSRQTSGMKDLTFREAPNPAASGTDAGAGIAFSSSGPGEDPRTTAYVTNVFYETDIRQVLSDISAQVGIPIVATTGIRGLVTMEFDDLPLEECLRRLVVPLGLTYEWMDGYYLVGESDPTAVGSVLLSKTIAIRPQHLLAKDAMRVLPKAYERYVQVDPGGANVLIATGSDEVLRSLERDVAVLDQPPRQVMIEALVVEVSQDLTREWGIDWEILGSEGDATFRLAKLAPAIGDSSFIGRLFDTSIEGLGSITDISVALRALEATGGARVKANPHVATLDGREARIRVGSEAYYSLLSGSVTYAYYTLQNIATGTSLKITPYVAASSEIITDISIEVSDVRTTGANDLPVTSVREVETRSCVGNGESVMIGGLLSETERTKDSHIPLLGRIPILGSLFGYTSVETEEAEMFVLVTPYILIEPTELAVLLE